MIYTRRSTVKEEKYCVEGRGDSNMAPTKGGNRQCIQKDSHEPGDQCHLCQEKAKVHQYNNLSTHDIHFKISLTNIFFLSRAKAFVIKLTLASQTLDIQHWILLN